MGEGPGVAVSVGVAVGVRVGVDGGKVGVMEGVKVGGGVLSGAGVLVGSRGAGVQVGCRRGAEVGVGVGVNVGAAARGISVGVAGGSGLNSANRSPRAAGNICGIATATNTQANTRMVVTKIIAVRILSRLTPQPRRERVRDLLVIIHLLPTIDKTNNFSFRP